MKSVITGYIAYTLKDKNGKVLLKGAKPFNSFVKNFMVMLETIFKGEDTKLEPPEPTQAVDIDGNSFTFSVYYLRNETSLPFGWRIDAEAGDTLFLRNEPTEWGIVVGSGDSPTTINFYKLESIYPHGKEAGYMNYLSTKLTEPEYDGTCVKFTINRLIVNEADVSQVVREIGLIAREYNSWKRWLVARDVLDSPVTMPAKSLLDITIVIAAVLAPYNVLYVSDQAVGFSTSQLSTF